MKRFLLILGLLIGMISTQAQNADFVREVTAKTYLNVSDWTAISHTSKTIDMEGLTYTFVSEKAKLSFGTNVNNHITDDAYFSSTATILKGSLYENGKIIGEARFAVVDNSLAGMAEIGMDTYKYRPDKNGTYYWEKQLPFKCGTECTHEHNHEHHDHGIRHQNNEPSGSHPGGSNPVMAPMDNCFVESIQDVAFITDDLYADYGNDLNAILAQIAIADSWAFDTMEDSGFPDIQFYQESAHVVDFPEANNTIANYQIFIDSLYVNPPGNIATIAQNATSPITILYCSNGVGGVASATTYPMPPGQYYDIVISDHSIDNYVKIHEYGHSLWGGHHEDQTPDPVVYRRAYLGTDGTWGNYVTTMGQSNFGGGVRLHRFSDDDPTAGWYHPAFEHWFTPVGTADRDMCRRISEEWNRPGIIQVIDLTPQTPTISANGPTTFCAGGSVVLSVDDPESGVTYHWSNGSTGNSITVTSTGNYDCYGQNGDCTGDDSNVISVIVNLVPNTPVISANDPTLCEGDICTLSVNTPQGGVTYHWSNGMTGNSIDVDEAGTYTCYGDNGDCQSGNSNAITVTVTAIPQTPTISANGSTTFCAGGSVVLSVDGPEAGVIYQWSNGATGNSITVTTTGNYSCYGQNGDCTGDDSNVIPVTVNPVPNTPVISANDPTLCDGDICTISVNTPQGGVTYHWSNGASGNSIDVTEAGSYTCYGDNGDCQSGNSNAITVTVTAIPTPASIYTNDPTSFCDDGLALLQAETTGHSGEICHWSTGETGPSIVVTESGNYSAHWENGDCVGDESDPIAITVWDSPTANAGPNQTLSYGESTTLAGSATGGTGSYDYWWEPSDKVVDPSDPNTATVNLTAPTTFTLTVTDDNGCIDDDDVFINVTGGPPSVVASADPDEICFGESTQLTATAGGGSGNYTYFWTADPTDPSLVGKETLPNPVVSPEITTTYTVEVNDGNETVSDDVTVTVYPLPVADFTAEPLGGSAPVTVEFENLSTHATSYFWDFGDGETSDEENPEHTYTQSGVYTVILIAYNELDCSDTIIKEGFIDVITGVNEITNNTINIYPNPTTGTLFIDAGKASERVEVISTNGRVIRQVTYPGIKAQFDLSDLPAGLYYLKIDSKQDVKVIKFIKK